MAYASNKPTMQNRYTISVNRDKFMDYVVIDERLSKKDLRVCLHLLTALNSSTYTAVSTKSIANTLNYKKSQVEECINNLIEYNIIEMGSSDSVEDGYRLLF